MLISARSYNLTFDAHCCRTYPSHRRATTAAWLKAQANRYDRRHPRDEMFCEVGTGEMLPLTGQEAQDSLDATEAYIAMMIEATYAMDEWEREVLDMSNFDPDWPLMGAFEFWPEMDLDNTPLADDLADTPEIEGTPGWGDALDPEDTLFLTGGFHFTTRP